MAVSAASKSCGEELIKDKKRNSCEYDGGICICVVKCLGQCAYQIQKRS